MNKILKWILSPYKNVRWHKVIKTNIILIAIIIILTIIGAII